MLLSARILTHVASPNIFRNAPQVQFTDGDAPSIVFQLVDLSVDRSQEGFNPPGRRYCPSPEAEVTVSLGSVFQDRRLTFMATPAFPDRDMSLWQIDLLPEDVVAGNTDLFLELTDEGKTIRGTARNVVVAHPRNGGAR